MLNHLHAVAHKRARTRSDSVLPSSDGACSEWEASARVTRPEQVRKRMIYWVGNGVCTESHASGGGR